MNCFKCYVKFLSGDVQAIDIFDGYRVWQLKHELIEDGFIHIYDDYNKYNEYNISKITVTNEEYETLSDRDILNMGEIYNIYF